MFIQAILAIAMLGLGGACSSSRQPSGTGGRGAARTHAGGDAAASDTAGSGAGASATLSGNSGSVAAQSSAAAGGAAAMQTPEAGAGGGKSADSGVPGVPLAPLTREPRPFGDAADRCGAVMPLQPAPTDAAGCSDPDARNYQARGTATGSNGAFTDECDANGDITEYVCETQYTMVPGCYVPGGGGGAIPGGGATPSGPATPQCPSAPTGRVVGQKLTCFGLCREGACGTFCPVMGDTVRYEQLGTDGSAVLANTCDGGRYMCTLLEDYPTPFDCVRSPTVGFTTTISMVYFFGGPDNCTGLYPKSTTPTTASPGSRHVEIQTRDRDAQGRQSACNYSCVIVE